MERLLDQLGRRRCGRPALGSRLRQETQLHQLLVMVPVGAALGQSSRCRAVECRQALPLPAGRVRGPHDPDDLARAQRRVLQAPGSYALPGARRLRRQARGLLRWARDRSLHRHGCAVACGCDQRHRPSSRAGPVGHGAALSRRGRPQGRALTGLLQWRSVPCSGEGAHAPPFLPLRRRGARGDRHGP